MWPKAAGCCRTPRRSRDSSAPGSSLNARRVRRPRRSQADSRRIDSARADQASQGGGARRGGRDGGAREAEPSPVLSPVRGDRERGASSTCVAVLGGESSESGTGTGTRGTSAGDPTERRSGEKSGSPVAVALASAI